jgi:hypothetical protein
MVALCTENRDDNVARIRRGDRGIFDRGHAECMENVCAFGASGGEPLKRELNARAKAGVGLHHGRRRRHGVRVRWRDRVARDAEQSAEILKVCTARIGQHYGASGVIDALTDEQFTVSRDLKNLICRIGFDQSVERFVARAKIDEHLGKDRLEIERLDDVGSRKRRKVDGGE